MTKLPVLNVLCVKMVILIPILIGIVIFTISLLILVCVARFLLGGYADYSEVDQEQVCNRDGTNDTDFDDYEITTNRVEVFQEQQLNDPIDAIEEKRDAIENTSSISSPCLISESTNDPDYERVEDTVTKEEGIQNILSTTTPCLLSEDTVDTGREVFKVNEHRKNDLTKMELTLQSEKVTNMTVSSTEEKISETNENDGDCKVLEPIKTTEDEEETGSVTLHTIIEMEVADSSISDIEKNNLSNFLEDIYNKNQGDTTGVFTSRTLSESCQKNVKSFPDYDDESFRNQSSSVKEIRTSSFVPKNTHSEVFPDRKVPIPTPRAKPLPLFPAGSQLSEIETSMHSHVFQESNKHFTKDNSNVSSVSVNLEIHSKKSEETVINIFEDETEITPVINDDENIETNKYSIEEYNLSNPFEDTYSKTIGDFRGVFTSTTTSAALTKNLNSINDFEEQSFSNQSSSIKEDTTPSLAVESTSSQLFPDTKVPIPTPRFKQVPTFLLSPQSVKIGNSMHIDFQENKNNNESKDESNIASVPVNLEIQEKKFSSKETVINMIEDETELKPVSNDAEAIEANLCSICDQEFKTFNDYHQHIFGIHELKPRGENIAVLSSNTEEEKPQNNFIIINMNTPTNEHSLQTIKSDSFLTTTYHDTSSDTQESFEGETSPIDKVESFYCRHCEKGFNVANAFIQHLFSKHHICFCKSQSLVNKNSPNQVLFPSTSMLNENAPLREKTEGKYSCKKCTKKIGQNQTEQGIEQHLNKEHKICFCQVRINDLLVK